MYVCDTAGLKVYFYKKIDGNLQKQQLVLGTNVKDFSTDYDKIDDILLTFPLSTRLKDLPFD